MLADIRCPKCSGNLLQFSCNVDLACNQCSETISVEAGKIVEIIHCRQYLFKSTVIAKSGNTYLPKSETEPKDKSEAQPEDEKQPTGQEEDEKPEESDEKPQSKSKPKPFSVNRSRRKKN
jgi:hypothetical protein